jgi:hypothetical protein
LKQVIQLFHSISYPNSKTPYKTARKPATIPTTPPIPAIKVGAAPVETWVGVVVGTGLEAPVLDVVEFPPVGGGVVVGDGILVVSAVTVLVSVVVDGRVVVLSAVAGDEEGAADSVVDAEAVAMEAE